MVTETLEFKQSSDMLCRQVSGIDDKIEIVTVLNRKGRVVEMVAREDGVINDLSPHKREMLFMEFALLNSMEREYNDELGRTDCLVVQREKVTAFSFEIFDHIMVILTRPVSDPVIIQQRIRNIIYSKI